MRLGVTYIASFLPYHIEKDLDELASIGCDDVLFAIQENHLDTLVGAVKYGPEIARARGLRPLAVVWGFLNTFGGGRMSKIMFDNPSLWRIGREGKPQAMVCLNNPDLMRHVGETAKKLRDAGFESFFIDEPTAQHCFCTHCQKAFSTWIGGQIAQADGETYKQFQRRTIVDYIERGCRAVKEVDRAIATICCLMPCDQHCSEAASKVKDLDMLGTDPYWLLPFMKLTLEQGIEDTVRLKKLCDQQGKQSQVWLNCWGIPAGVEAEIYTGGKRLAEIGCDSFFTWSFRGGLGTNEECANAALAWENLSRLYRELSKAKR